MKAIQIKEYVKSPKDLKVVDVPDLEAQDAEYTIRVHAAATNFFDILQVQGKYQMQPPFPWIAGFEFAGVVTAVPTGQDDDDDNQKPIYPVGTRVFGAAQGAYAEYVHAPAQSLLPVPEGWSLRDAAGLFVTAPTSYAGLVHRVGVKEGDYVLVHAAAGGVGLAAVQIAKALGATVIATASTPEKLAVARSFGADHGILYGAAPSRATSAPDQWPARVRELTPDERGVDVVFDPVGLVEASTRCLAWRGRVLVVGFAGGAVERVAMNRPLLKNAAIVGLAWGAHSLHEPELVPVVWRGVLDLVQTGRLRGTQFDGRSFVGLGSVPDALEALAGRDTWGKVVVDVVPPEESSKL